tara:strand:- start:51 stop:380 length:330 start_codon:yes stop_codon:yes gene_type:complete
LKFKNLYLAANSAEAHIIQGLLVRESIKVNLVGEGLSIAAGGLPADVYQIKILVEEKQYNKALDIIKEYEKILKSENIDQGEWRCMHCDNLNPKTFDICWSCNSSKKIL